MTKTEQQITDQLTAMRGELFELLLLRLDEKREGQLLTVTLPQLLRRVSWLRAQNAQGMNVNIRPKGNHLSLLDDLTPLQLDNLKATGYQPCAIIETSPGNYQAWLDHGRELSDDEASSFARQLAEKAGCDLAAAGRRHAGRLAGFTNRKSKHRKENGLYPFVRLHYAAQRIFDQAPTLTLPQPEPVSNHYITTPHASKTIRDFHDDPRYDGDGSRADFAYALYGHSHGLSETDIVDAILTRDMSHKGNAISQRKYAIYTTHRARRHVKPQA